MPLGDGSARPLVSPPAVPEGSGRAFTSGAQPRPPRSPTVPPWRGAPWRVAPWACGAMKCGAMGGWCHVGRLKSTLNMHGLTPNQPPTTNRHSGFPRTAAARAVTQDAIYTCFHYEGQPSTAIEDPRSQQAVRPPAAPEAHPLAQGCPLGPREERSRRLDADYRLRWRPRACLRSPCSPHCTAFGPPGLSSARSTACRGPGASAAGRTRSSSSG